VVSRSSVDVNKPIHVIRILFQVISCLYACFLPPYLTSQLSSHFSCMSASSMLKVRILGVIGDVGTAVSTSSPLQRRPHLVRLLYDSERAI